jgi:Skp family chaperone for outer membrane proteins
MSLFIDPLAFLNFEFPFPLVVSIWLLLIVLVVAIVSRLGVLPEKGARYLTATLLGFLGVAVCREYRSRKLAETARELEKHIKQKEESSRDILEKSETVESKAHDSQIESRDAEEDLKGFQEVSHKEKEGFRKQSLRVKEKNKQEKSRIDSLTDDEVFLE